MKILIKFCLVCIITLFGVGTIQAQMTTTVTPATGNYCFSVTVTTDDGQPAYYLNIVGGGACYNVKKCTKTVCFDVPPNTVLTQRLIECQMRKTPESFLIKDGCIVVVGPG